MSAPSPVSALIHAATLVTSGIFLLVKFSSILEFSYNLIFIGIMGIFTAFFAGATGLVQNDGKRIVAYSTCSQLGYMTFSCGISQYNLAFFHLINRGCFKALLFLGIGSLIRNSDNKQDIRDLGNLIKTLPANYSIFIVGSLTLVGFPFLSGFYSKDLIIETTFINFSFHGFPIYFFSIIVAILTTAYSTRLIFFVFLKRTNLNKLNFNSQRDSGLFILFSLLLLTVLSIFNGYIFSDMFTGIGSDFYNNNIFFKNEHYALLNAEYLKLGIKNIPLILTLMTIFITILLLNKAQWEVLNKRYFSYFIYVFLLNKWYIDFIQNRISFKLLKMSHNLTFKLIDKGILENVGPTGLTGYFKSLIIKVINFQSGFLYRYLLTIFLS